MIDAILYVPDFPALVTHLNAEYPYLLERNENGDMVQPPVVTGISRTPAVQQGIEVMVYARLYQHEVEQWGGMPGVEILGKVEYSGRGTAADLYSQVLDDPEKREIYDRVYPRETETYEVEGQTYEYTPSLWFGIMAGA